MPLQVWNSILGWYPWFYQNATKPVYVLEYSHTWLHMIDNLLNVENIIILPSSIIHFMDTLNVHFSFFFVLIFAVKTYKYGGQQSHSANRNTSIPYTLINNAKLTFPKRMADSWYMSVSLTLLRISCTRYNLDVCNMYCSSDLQQKKITYILNCCSSYLTELVSQWMRARNLSKHKYWCEKYHTHPHTSFKIVT